MKPNMYTLIARWVPAVLCVAPLVLIYVFLIRDPIKPFFDAYLSLKWVADVPTTAVLLFAMAMAGRAAGKDIFERWWFGADGIRMPTTLFLLYKDGEYSPEFKARLRTKIRVDFGIQLPSVDEESTNEQRSRKRIAEAVSQIRLKVRGGHLVFQHNAEYGFIRNLAGGALIGALISLVAIFLFRYYPNYQATVAAMVMLGFYACLLLFARPVANAHGKRYARVLFQEYMGS